MNDVALVSPSDLLSDKPGEITAPKPREKLYAEDFPGVVIIPIHPGANVGRHPITRQFVSLRPKPKPVQPEPEPELEIKPPVALPDEFPSDPLKPAVDTATDETTGATDTAEGAAADDAPPDFSDLGGSDKSGGGEKKSAPSMAEAMKSYREMSAVVWDYLIAFLATMFGPAWHPRPSSEIGIDERGNVIGALSDWLASINFFIMSPFQRVCLHVGTYFWSRVGTVVTWYKKRKHGNASEQTIDVEPATVEANGKGQGRSV